MNRERSEGGATTFDRRRWLAACLVGWALPGSSRAGPGPIDDAKDVEAKLRKLGLSGVGSNATPHYRGLGNATEAFRKEAVAACESLAGDFLRHFRDRKFEGLELPADPLTMVVLDGPNSYGLYTGEKADDAIGGHYELDTNRLVVFDFRGRRENLNIAAERVNTIVLVHEAAHQLTFNTGMLDRTGDFPLAICEGLATYCETWRPRRAAQVGGKNLDRYRAIGMEIDGGANWIPLRRLLVEDDLMNAKETRDLAYAESWLLVHTFLKTPARAARLRDYLAAIRPRRDPSHRLEDARRCLGDLAGLDKELQRTKIKG